MNGSRGNNVFSGPRSNGYGGGGGGDARSGWGGSSQPSWESPPARAPVRTDGQGVWRDGRHIPGASNPRLEKELYGDPDGLNVQRSGINFEKYDDIPVEATGTDVPEPLLQFASPPLDQVLLENIRYARYTTPTPVQKYSIPIVAGGRDLMACAQVNITVVFQVSPLISFTPRLALAKLVDSFFLSSRRRSRKALVQHPTMKVMGDAGLTQLH